jgi:hypothetical protein
MDDQPTPPTARTVPDDRLSPDDIGIIFTALCLHCAACNAVFYETVAGRVRRVNNELMRIDEKGRAHALAHIPCPECLSQDLQLWELL